VRAIVVRRFGGPEVLEIEELPLPVPGPGELLVRLHAVGVNPVEAYVRSGIGVPPALPYTPGSDAAGVVEAVGGPAAADTPPVGARVYVYGSINGTYAEYALCRPEHVFALADDLSFAQGAGLGVPYGTAYRALFQRAGACAPQTVLVHGATGGVGLAAVQLAATAGLTVVATGSTEEGRRLALAQGAAHAVDHGAEDHLERAFSLTGGKGFDVIVEMRSELNLGRDLAVLAPAGRVACVGNRGPGNEGAVGVNARDLMRREGAVLGVMLPNADHAEVRAIHRALAAGAADGAVRPVVAREYPLEQAVAAHRDLLERSSLGKFVLVP
jgi:NADPH2:quinone reductase